MLLFPSKVPQINIQSKQVGMLDMQTQMNTTLTVDWGCLVVGNILNAFSVLDNFFSPSNVTPILKLRRLRAVKLF